MRGFEKIPTAKMVAAARPPIGFVPVVSHSPFGWKIGPFFEREDSVPIMRGFRASAHHLDRKGTVAPGVISGFADILLSKPVLMLSKGPFVTLSMTIDTLGSVLEGEWVEGTASLNDTAEDILSVQGNISTGGRPVAHVRALFKHFKARVHRAPPDPE